MTTAEFLKRAHQEISDNPWDRLSPATRKLAEDPDTVFDVHCHIFDRRCLTIRYIALRMLKSGLLGLLKLESTQSKELREALPTLAKNEEVLYREIAAQFEETEEDWKAFEAELNIVAKQESLTYGGLKTAIKVLKEGSMEAVYRFFYDKMAVRNMLQGPPMISGILLMDLNTGWNIQPLKSYRDQVLEVKALTQSDPILPFFAVDPRRADRTGKDNLYELFLEAFTGSGTPFFGLKCYPALGYRPYDDRLAPIFEICEAKNIPVTSHCGGEAVSTFEKSFPLRYNGVDLEELLPGKNRKMRARGLNDPKHWHKVLERFPKLRLNLAHFGSDFFWSAYLQNGKDDRLQSIMDLLLDDRYQVYTDFSYNVIVGDTYKSLLEVLTEHPKLKDKIMYGTDYWVVLPAGDLAGQQRSFLKEFKVHQEQLLREVPRKFLFG